MELLTIDNGLNSIDGIQAAITECKDPVMLAVLNTLLESKQREIELSAKLASKKTSTSKLSTAETVLKSVFVACRPQVLSNAPEDYATKAFKAAITALNIEFTAELQASIFASSSVHCLKSNFNKKNNNIGESYNSYLEAVRQARLLLPKISDETWNAWLKSVQEAAVRAAKKRGISWTVPAVQPDTEIVPAAADTEIVPAAADTEIVPAAADKKKVIITTRGKRK